MKLRAAVALAVVALAGCGGGSHPSPSTASPLSPLPPGYTPIPAGRGQAYRPPALSSRAEQRLAIDGLRCIRQHPRPYAIHLELYARGLVMPVPAGIGVAPPVHRIGAYVRGGRCSYALRTFEPTGVVLVDPHRRLRLGTLFAVWGTPLGLTRLAGFTGPLFAYVEGHRWYRAPGLIPLRRHAEIVLEADGYVTPHTTYRFPPGL